MRHKDLSPHYAAEYSLLRVLVQGGPSYEYQHDRVKMVFKKSLLPCGLDESSLTIGRAKHKSKQFLSY